MREGRFQRRPSKREVTRAVKCARMSTPVSSTAVRLPRIGRRWRYTQTDRGTWRAREELSFSDTRASITS